MIPVFVAPPYILSSDEEKNAFAQDYLEDPKIVCGFRMWHRNSTSEVNWRLSVKKERFTQNEITRVYKFR